MAPVTKLTSAEKLLLIEHFEVAMSGNGGIVVWSPGIWTEIRGIVKTIRRLQIKTMKSTDDPARYRTTIVYRKNIAQIAGRCLTFDEEPSLEAILNKYKTLLETESDDEKAE